jgi:hypothetical protein
VSAHGVVGARRRALVERRDTIALRIDHLQESLAAASRPGSKWTRERENEIEALNAEFQRVDHDLADLRTDASDMSLAYIRDTYGVPANVGQRIRFTGTGGSQEGEIVGGTSAHLMVTFAGGGGGVLHPTWGVEYLTTDRKVQP